MSVNKHKPHLYIVPEDDADRQLAAGFLLHGGVDVRAVQSVPLAGGWRKAQDVLVEEYLPMLERNEHCHVLLLIDLDEHGERQRSQIEDAVPAPLADRVFILGCADDPEALNRALGRPGLESIGTTLAEECYQGQRGVWRHGHLDNNRHELARLTATVRPFLFRSTPDDTSVAPSC